MLLNLGLFADDSIIYRDIKTQDDCLQLQQDLDSAARWEADWLMAFHPNKCTKLTVAQKKPIQHNYILHNHILDSETSAKYLGITLQSNLKRNLHYDKSLGFLKRNLTVLNTDIKSIAYQALVKPKLEYGCSAWDPHTNEYKKKIEMV